MNKLYIKIKKIFEIISKYIYFFKFFKTLFLNYTKNTQLIQLWDNFHFWNIWLYKKRQQLYGEIIQSLSLAADVEIQEKNRQQFTSSGKNFEILQFCGAKIMYRQVFKMTLRIFLGKEVPNINLILKIFGKHQLQGLLVFFSELGRMLYGRVVVTF